MTDKERKRRRMELEKRMRDRREGNSSSESSFKGLLVFRTYVTVILAGAMVLVSAFHTETSEAVCSRLKEVIAYQIPAEDVTMAKEKFFAFWKDQDINLPAFNEKETPKETPKENKVYKPDLEESP